MTVIEFDIRRHFELAGKILSEGLHKDYWRRHFSRQDDVAIQTEVMVLIEDATAMDNLVSFADAQFNALYNQYKFTIRTLPEKRKEAYHRLISSASTAKEEPWDLPQTIDFNINESSTPFSKHMYFMEDGTFLATLNNWEAGVLREELSKPDVVCWIRNLDRKKWALAIPYEVSGSKVSMYPDVSTVRMTIFQPRRENISTFEMSTTDLLAWAENVLAPTARLAFNGEGEFKAGDHCQFCTAKATCRKRTEYNLEMARYDFEVPSELTDDEIAAILPRIDELITWGGDVKEYALQQAVSGTRYPGFKVVEGRSVTKYTDDEAVAAAVKAAGEDPYERKLLGITAMKALLGKKRFDDILGGLTYKPPGKPTLVSESDKRPAMNTAKNDFMEEKDHE